MGRVYLVGAGPGDPELITIKGLDCLKSADVVIYDRLSSKALLSFCRPGTEFVFVGKAGGEYHPHPQSSINRLILEKAQEGGRVVRLKGGDPFVFGRGGEEALYLRRNGVEVEVVPGVSSAQGVPAYAGIPLTDRKLASSVALVTGHEDPQKFRSEVDWAKLATATGTVVIFMALKNLGFICDQFIEHGRPPDTPVALVRWGTLPEQQTIVGTLSDILSKAEAARLEPPVTIVVGEVVGLRDELKWFESQQLFGKKVVVTRAVEQIGEVSEAFRRRGAVVLEFPTIKIGSPPNYEAVDGALQEMASQGARPAFDWLVFTSSNAVDWFFSRVRERGHDARVLAHASIAAIGEATAERLNAVGLLPDYVPEDARAEGLIDGLEVLGVEGARILIPRALKARELLPKALASLGARVVVAPVYQNLPGDPPEPQIRSMIELGGVDIITFTSSSTARNFRALLPELDPARDLERTLVACIGPVTADTARKLGFAVDIVPEQYTIEAMVDAIVMKVAART